MKSYNKFANVRVHLRFDLSTACMLRSIAKSLQPKWSKEHMKLIKRGRSAFLVEWQKLSMNQLIFNNSAEWTVLTHRTLSLVVMRKEKIWRSMG